MQPESPDEIELLCHIPPVDGRKGVMIREALRTKVCHASFLRISFVPGCGGEGGFLKHRRLYYVRYELN